VPKKKLVHFAENDTFPHLFQPRYHELLHGFFLRGKWHEGYFRNPNPVILELGCGKGEYTVGLAETHPDRNYIGIDVKGARLWRGCRTVAEKQMKNVAFIRTLVDHVGKLFAPGEISGIWITFPDPQPKKAWKRLTSPEFLEKYRSILRPGSILHLKTDNPGFYEYTIDVIREQGHKILAATEDLYHSGITDEVIGYRTFYEKMWLEQGMKICYLKFVLADAKEDRSGEPADE
jgi:tRNA (guanine-N7-)-methyltransferase